MRTEALARLIQAYTRVRGQTRRLLARAPTTSRRWLIGLVALAMVAWIAYAVTGTPSPTGAYVRSGSRFSEDDVLAITSTLNAKHLPFHVMEDGRIEVSADRLDDANDAIAKLEVGPRRLDDIEKKRDEGYSILAGIDERLERAEKVHSEQLAGYIRRLPGVASARVSVSRPKNRDSRRTASGATAFVWLETQGKREIPHKVVKSIQSLIVGNDPDIKPTAITIMDQTGDIYLDAQNPSLGALSRQRAREEEFREEISKKLDWLRGANISVQLVVRPDAAPPPTAALITTAHKESDPVPAPPAEEVNVAAPPKMSMNQPLETEPETAPDAAAPHASKVAAPSAEPAKENPAEEAESTRSLARVLVTVPRSFYLGRVASRDPSLDELQALMTRTERTIKKSVEIVIPPDRLGEVTVSVIPDDLPPTSPPPSVNTDTRRSLSWWVLAGTVAGATIVALGVALRNFSFPRPVLRPAVHDREREEWGRYELDEPSTVGPTPSERVRELIRQNPEAAASVLHRWTGQGGPIG